MTHLQQCGSSQGLISLELSPNQLLSAALFRKTKLYVEFLLAADCRKSCRHSLTISGYYEWSTLAERWGSGARGGPLATRELLSPFYSWKALRMVFTSGKSVLEKARRGKLMRRRGALTRPRSWKIHCRTYLVYGLVSPPQPCWTITLGYSSASCGEDFLKVIQSWFWCFLAEHFLHGRH